MKIFRKLLLLPVLSYIFPCIAMFGEVIDSRPGAREYYNARSLFLQGKFEDSRKEAEKLCSISGTTSQSFYKELEALFRCSTRLTKVEVSSVPSSSPLSQDEKESIAYIIGQYVEQLLDKKDILNAKEWMSVEESLSPKSIAVTQHKYMLNCIEQSQELWNTQAW